MQSPVEVRDGTIVLGAGLWERPPRTGSAREQVIMFNLVTLATVAPTGIPAPKRAMPGCKFAVLATVTRVEPMVVPPVVRLVEEFGLTT